ncbi:MAG: hypothetical protein LAO21_07925 [Acidobacteriia bacterium]|nr:hypothetical protein [Terriglobia bacterium]
MQQKPFIRVNRPSDSVLINLANVVRVEYRPKIEARDANLVLRLADGQTQALNGAAAETAFHYLEQFIGVALD